MPGLFKLLIQSPNADQAGVLALTGFHTGADLFLASDPTPRNKWGGRTSTAFSAQDELDLPTWQAAFPSTLFEIYHVVSGKTVPAQRLLDWGLTTSASV